MNRVKLRGRYLHSRYDKKLHRNVLTMRIDRAKSGYDLLNVMYDKKLMRPELLFGRDAIYIEGELASYNNRGKLIVYVVADLIDFSSADEPHMNEVEFDGIICKTAELHQTSYGKDVYTMISSVQHRTGTAYVPTVTWWKTAKFCSKLEVGTKLHCTGTLQSRRYTVVKYGKEMERTAYEVSCIRAIKEQ